MKTRKRKALELSGIIIIVVIITTIVAITLLKYHVEGEKDMPYVIKQMVVISTANGENVPTGNSKWNININQSTDIFFEIARNEQHKSSETIKMIQIQNIRIMEAGKYVHKAYMPSADSEETFTYTDKNVIQNELTYTIDKNQSLQNKTITTEGGIIGISFCASNIASYIGNDDKMTYDGTLLKKVGVKIEDIKASVKFDLILETESGKKYKTEIVLSVPEEDITKSGISIIKDNELSDIVFKRIN